MRRRSRRWTGCRPATSPHFDRRRQQSDRVAAGILSAGRMASDAEAHDQLRARWDWMSAFVTRNQFSPRIAIEYELRPRHHSAWRLCALLQGAAVRPGRARHRPEIRGHHQCRAGQQRQRQNRSGDRRLLRCRDSAAHPRRPQCRRRWIFQARAQPTRPRAAGGQRSHRAA